MFRAVVYRMCMDHPCIPLAELSIELHTGRVLVRATETTLTVKT